MQQQFANILSNGSLSFAPSNGSNHGHVYGKPIHARSTPSGFTVLQGHIQLMAMVPTLPENQLSPRVRPQDSFPKIQTQSQRPTPRESPQPLEFSPPHITRMMPSATKFKPAQLMPQSSFAGSYPSLRELPQLPEMSLPPKPVKPIAMPSFGRHLHSAHRLVSRETFVQYSSNQHQPTVQHHTQSHQQTYSNPFPQPPQTPFPPFANASMSYQMVNYVPQTPQYESPRRNGSGDYSPLLFQFQQQQQQQQQQPMQPSYELPYNTYPPKSPIKNQIQLVQYPIGYPHHQHPQQPHHHHVSQAPQQPYAAQSVPCFGTLYGQQIQQPMCSASMPQICVNSQQPSMPPSPTPLVRMPPIHHHQNQALPPRTQTVTLSVHPSESKSQGKMVKTDAFGITNKNSSESGSGSDFELQDAASKKNNKNATRVVSRVSQLIVPPQPDEHLCQQINQAKTIDSARFRTLGPDSNPTRIPSKPKVVHSQTKLQQNDWNKECKENQSCSNCKKCLSKLKPPPQHSGEVSSDDQDFRMRVRKKLSSDLTPRMKPKPVVVAVHDCFPSDSSVSDANCSDVEVTTTSPRRPALSNGPFLRGKRKPRESIYKIKNKRGDPSEEVFDVLHDLNPDEARTFTCEYLVELLSSSDWSQCHLGLETMVRLARHRPKTLLNYLGPILWYAFNHLTSPKSALCRAAIVTFTELFQRIGSALDNDLEKLTEKLVVKSLAPNMFIRQECDKALEAMVNHCSLLKVLGAIEHVSKKSHVRAICPRIANMTRQFIKVAGVDTCLKPLYAEKILPMLFTFMTVANNETRSSAKQALAMLMNHLQFEPAVTKHVTFDRNCTEVFKKLDKMRGRNRNRSCGGITRPYPSTRQFKK